MSGMKATTLDDLGLRLQEARMIYERVRARAGPSRDLDFVGVYLRRAIVECDREAATARDERAPAQPH